MNTRRWFALVAVLAVGVFLLPACSGKSDKKEDDKKGDEKKGDEKKGVADAKPDFTLTSKQFAEEFEKDRKAAQAKYRGKVIELTGVVGSIMEGFLPHGVSLKGGTSRKGLSLSVPCVTGGKKLWQKVVPGQTVKLKGTCPDEDHPIGLDNCIITEVSGPAPPSLTAEELAKAYAAGPDKAKEKYEQRYIFVSGEIGEVSAKEGVLEHVSLKTGGELMVHCFFNLEGFSLQDLKPGKRIKVLGECHIIPLGNLATLTGWAMEPGE